jgi:hypothetical protein
MTLYPDNIREFVTQKSVRLGESGFDVEVEIVRRSNLETVERKGKEVVSIGLKEYSPLPEMEPNDLFVVFDLGTVLDVDDVRFADAESGGALPVKRETKRKHRGPVRVPVALKASARVSLLLSADNRPMGTLTVDIGDDGRLADATFLPDQEAI